VKRLSEDIGIPRGLGEVGVREEHLDCIAAEAVKSGNVPVNPRRASAEDLKHILQEAL
jgi:alcohol dehydrogenase